MHIEPNGTQIELAERFDEICRRVVTPQAKRVDATGRVAPETWRMLAEAGYLGLFHPPEFGGSGACGFVQARAMESLARACASTFWAASISTALTGKMLAELCGPVHHERWLRAIVAGERIGCFAASEDGAGSDPGSYRAVVERTARGFRLTGRKSRISNAGVADVAVVLARLGRSDGPDLCYAVVDLSRPGVTRGEIPKLGLRGMSWGTLDFAGVELDAVDVVENASIEKTLRTVEWGQLIQAYCGLGIAASALELSQEYAMSRHAFGRPIGHLERVYERIVEMHVAIDGARELAHEVSCVKARGELARETVLMAKIHATEMAVSVADSAMRVHGGWGWSREHAIERLYRDSLGNVPAGLPNDRLRELLACQMLGVDPWTYASFAGLEPGARRLV